MDATEFRDAAHKVIEDIIHYFSTLPTLRPLSQVSPGYLRPQLPATAPTDPEPFTSLLHSIETTIKPGLTHWQSPRFMAFFPATVTFPSILGEMYSAAFNAPAFNWLCSPACTELETVVLDWVAKILGLPSCFLSDGETGGGGVIQGSASEAVLPVMVAARELHVQKALAAAGVPAEEAGESEETRRRREDVSAECRGRLMSLASEHAHSLGLKAANILGIRHRAVRAGAESGYRMTGKALREKIEEVEAQGLVPFFVTVTLGTTATCAVDEMEEIAKIKRERPDLWIHVDAAYAGAALCCEELRDVCGAKFLEQFDSFDFNMHKWMLVNFDASCLFLKNRLPVTRAMSVTPTYLQNPAAISGLVTDYRDWQIPLGRRFRSLRIWFVLRTYGVTKIQNMIRKHIQLGQYFAERVAERPDLLEIVAGPQFALTVIRCLIPRQPANGTIETSSMNVERKVDEAEMNDFETKKGSAANDESNALTKRVCELINERGEFFLTGAVVCGTYVIRVVSANELAEIKYMKEAFDVIVATTEEKLADRGADGK